MTSAISSQPSTGDSSKENKNKVFASRNDAQTFVSDLILNKYFNEKNDETGSVTNNSSRKVSRCGNLRCQHDSLLRHLDTEVLLAYASFKVDSNSSSKSSSSSKKKAKRKKQQSHSTQNGEGGGTNAGKLSPYGIKYAIVLSDSIFFPEGGGQPSDHGTITFLPEGEGKDENDRIKLTVSDAQNVNSICILICEQQPTDELVLDKIPAFSKVKQSINWDRRSDVMIQHSAQHLISAVALNEPYGIQTNSFSLQLDGTNYLDFKVADDGSNSILDIDKYINIMMQIEVIVNNRIRENLVMKPKWLYPSDDEFQDKVRSRLLPDGLTGKIRLVEIGDNLDFNTCCGTHVPTLGYIQMIKFFKIEKFKSNILRVQFAAGFNRLNKIINDMFARQLQFTSMLSCKEDGHVDRLTQVLDDKQVKEREVKSLNEKVCMYQSYEVLKECEENYNVAVIDLSPNDDSTTVDMGYMNMLSSMVIQEKINVESTADGSRFDDVFLLLFVCRDRKADKNDQSGSFLLTGTAELVAKVGKKVAEIFEGRGGGKNGKFQGKGNNINSSSICAVKEMLVKSKEESNKL